MTSRRARGNAVDRTEQGIDRMLRNVETGRFERSLSALTLDDRAEPGDQAHHDGRGDQHRGRDDHGQRGALPARGGFGRLLGRHLGHPGILARRVSQTIEHAARDAQDRPAGQDGAGHEHRHDPLQAMGPGALVDVAFAEERPERRQVGQAESGQGEHHPGDAQVTGPPVQPGLVDRAEPVQDDSGAQEQRGPR